MFDWVAKIAIKKGLNRGIKTFVGLLAGGGALEALKQFGITVQVDEKLLAGALGGALLGLYEVVRNYQKSKGQEAVQLP